VQPPTQKNTASPQNLEPAASFVASSAYPRCLIGRSLQPAPILGAIFREAQPVQLLHLEKGPQLRGDISLLPFAARHELRVSCQSPSVTWDASFRPLRLSRHAAASTCGPIDQETNRERTQSCSARRSADISSPRKAEDEDQGSVRLVIGASLY